MFNVYDLIEFLEEMGLSNEEMEELNLSKIALEINKDLNNVIVDKLVNKYDIPIRRLKDGKRNHS